MLFKKISIKMTVFIAALLISNVLQAHPGHEHSSFDQMVSVIGYGALAMLVGGVIFLSLKSITINTKGDKI